MALKRKKEPPKEKLYTFDEVCTILQVDRRKLMEWVQYRKIPHIRINGQVRFKMSEIARWMMEKQKPRKKFSFE